MKKNLINCKYKNKAEAIKKIIKSLREFGVPESYLESIYKEKKCLHSILVIQ